MNTIFTKIIALTGTIGSGKTTACSILESFGATIISADKLARQVVEPGSRILDEIVAHFGSNLLKSDGSLDRKALAQIVFNSSSQRKVLEKITHPAIRKLAHEQCQNALDNGKNPIIYEIPLFFESGANQSNFKLVILIKANDEVCIKRTVIRDAITEDEARARIAAQTPTAEKEKCADIVVDNSGSLEQLKDRLKQVFEQIK